MKLQFTYVNLQHRSYVLYYEKNFFRVTVSDKPRLRQLLGNSARGHSNFIPIFGYLNARAFVYFFKPFRYVFALFTYYICIFELQMFNDFFSFNEFQYLHRLWLWLSVPVLLSDRLSVIEIKPRQNFTLLWHFFYFIQMFNKKLTNRYTTLKFPRVTNFQFVTPLKKYPEFTKFLNHCQNNIRTAI